jgi:hypothetical protein
MVGMWAESDLDAAFVERGGLGDGPQPESAAVPGVVILRPVHLVLPLFGQAAVREVGELLPIGVPAAHGVAHQVERALPTLRVGVHREEPCGVGGLFADQAVTRPTVLVDDPLQGGGVISIHHAHQLVVAVGGLTVAAYAARFLVGVRAAQEFGGEVGALGVRGWARVRLWCVGRQGGARCRPPGDAGGVRPGRGGGLRADYRLYSSESWPGSAAFGTA